MKTWPNIYPQSDGFIVDCGVVAGRRDRKYFGTKPEAQSEAKRRRDDRRRGMDGALSISDSDLLDAVEAKRILSGTGLTLKGLAEKAISSGARTSMLVDDLYNSYLSEKTNSGIRRRSLKNIESREGRFKKDFSGSHLSEITGPKIKLWLDEKRWKPVTRNTYLRSARSLLSYALKNEWIGKNPALSVDFVRTEAELPTVFSVDTVKKIMTWCVKNKPKVVPYYAIAFFSGIRPEEVRRIRRENISFEDGIITVSPGASKTHMRHVDIQPNLRAWLESYPVKKSVYWSRRVFRDLVDGLELKWGHDVARKSFISYHLAAFRNQHETALQAGHKTTDMIYTVYRNIATTDGQKITKDYAAEYWNVFPKKDALNPEAKTKKKSVL